MKFGALTAAALAAVVVLSGCTSSTDPYAAVDAVARQLDVPSDTQVILTERFGGDTVVEGPKPTYRRLLAGDVRAQVEQQLRDAHFSEEPNGWVPNTGAERVRVTLYQMRGGAKLERVVSDGAVTAPSEGATLVTIRDAS